jgi:general secretion pathway protein A
MYIEHFGLQAEPFGLTPDPTFLYLSPEHREALAAVQYGLLDGRGFITLMGEVGTGKTTLLYSLLSQLGPETQIAYIAYTTQDFGNLLAAALKDLGAEVKGTSKHELLSTFNALLLRAADEGRTVALVIDEAQNLTDEAFEELRLLSNFETYETKLVQIVLVGQPELQARLRDPRLRQLRERVSVRTFINPLTATEMRRYIEHRLQRAGGPCDLFTPAALNLIVRRTQGIPRRANILCHNALLFAFGRNLDRVSAGVAREAIAEMDERRPGLFRRAGLKRVRPPSWVTRWVAALGFLVLVVLLLDRLTPPALSRGRLDLPSAGEPAMAPPADLPAAAPDVPEARPEAEATPPAEQAPPSAAVVEPPSPPVNRAVAVAGLPSAASARQVKPVVRAGTEKDGNTPFLMLTVPRGGTVSRLLRDIYGPEANLRELMLAIRRLNPWITNLDQIADGETLRLPWPPASEGRS